MKHDLKPFGQLILTSTSLDPIQTPTVIQIRGSITLMDQSVLFIRENHVVDREWIDYSYHWQTADYQLIIRWDNAHAVNLPTSPYHQHVGSEENVQPSEPMTLDKVLTFIADRIVGLQPATSD